MYYRNGTPAGELPVVGPWTKSRASAAGNCVELAELNNNDVAMRNSRDPEGPALVFNRDDIRTFVLGARAGDFARFH